MREHEQTNEVKRNKIDKTHDDGIIGFRPFRPDTRRKLQNALRFDLDPIE